MKDGRRRVRPSDFLSRVRLKEQTHPAPRQPAARHTSGTQGVWGVRRATLDRLVRRLRRHSAAVASRLQGVVKYSRYFYCAGVGASAPSVRQRPSDAARATATRSRGAASEGSLVWGVTRGSQSPSYE
jgi:hypothetical protein